MNNTSKSIATVTRQERRIFLRWVARQVQELPLAIFGVGSAEAEHIQQRLLRAMQVLVKQIEGRVQPRNVTRCVARAVKSNLEKAANMVVTANELLTELFNQWIGNRENRTRMLTAYTRRHCAWRVTSEGQLV